MNWGAQRAISVAGAGQETVARRVRLAYPEPQGAKADMHVNRRQLITTSSAALGAAFLPLPVEARPSTYGFLRESGKRGEWPLVIGLLVTENPTRHNLAIELLRRRNNYPRTLRYASTDRYKCAFATAIIDYTARAADLVFTTLVVDDAAGRWSTIVAKDRVYSAVYRQLLVNAPSDIVIRLPHRADNRRDQALRQFLAGDLGINIEATDHSNLTQLAGFLAGCVYSEVTGVANAMKQSHADRLRQRMGANTARFSASVTSI